jgi:hypothetical protein
MRYILRRGRGWAGLGKETGQGQLKLKKKCRYKVINCQACRNPNLLETQNFHFFAFSAHTLSLSHVGSVECSLARAAAMRHGDWYSSFSSSVTALVVSCTHPALYSLLFLLASAWFRFSFVLHNCSFYVTGYTTASGWCWRLRNGAEAAAGWWRRFVGEWVGGNRRMRRKRRRRRLERSLSTHGAPNVSSSSSPYASW